jgi:RNA polymerase sigma-70 factor (ECF subfamily)
MLKLAFRYSPAAVSSHRIERYAEQEELARVACQVDGELVRRAKEGDESALIEIYNRCQPPVYRYVVFRVGSAALAEELTADVFVRMVERLHAYREQGRPILAWLYTIAHNLVVDHQRRQGRQAWLPLDEALAAHEEAQPTQVVEARETQAQLLAALETLTEPQRQVVILKFMEACSNAEVAAILGKDEGSVKSLQHRALAAMRRTLRARRHV